jgi:hypothetical protein
VDFSNPATIVGLVREGGALAVLALVLAGLATRKLAFWYAIDEMREQRNTALKERDQARIEKEDCRHQLEDQKRQTGEWMAAAREAVLLANTSQARRRQVVQAADRVLPREFTVE